jgi:hypothetical protein
MKPDAPVRKTLVIRAFPRMHDDFGALQSPAGLLGQSLDQKIGEEPCAVLLSSSDDLTVANRKRFKCSGGVRDDVEDVLAGHVGMVMSANNGSVVMFPH